jgi:3D (Asp-Asp-Asp) domain-containing protein
VQYDQTIVWKPLSIALICPVAVIATQVTAEPTARKVNKNAFAATSKLKKEGLSIERTEMPRGRDSRCCGYPLAAPLGFALRFYWLALESDYDDPEEIEYAKPDAVEIYTRDGLFMGAIPEKLAWSLRMEGSGLMSDGRVINYHGACNFGYGTCFTTLDENEYPFGRGAGTRPLIPFKSVAIDQRLVAIGDPLYIPEFDGMHLPDGSIHDGCVRADDTGGGIKKQKMDFFVVTYGNFRALLSELWGVSAITPHVMAPKCEYLRDL